MTWTGILCAVLLLLVVQGEQHCFGTTPDQSAIDSAHRWARRAFAEPQPATQPPGESKTGRLGLPFSFKYGGRPSDGFLGEWTYSRTAGSDDRGPYEVVSYRDPETALSVECEVRTFSDSAVVDWVLYLTNNGTADTPIIEDILPLDTSEPPGGSAPYGALTLRWSNGDRYFTNDPSLPTWSWGETQRSFMPHDDELARGTTRAFASKGSFRHLPFFNLQDPGGGWILAVGWTGRWKAEFELTEEGRLKLRAGMKEKTRFSLKPGERVRTPRIVLLRWTGSDMIAGHNRFRKLMVDHYVPREGGRVALPPIAGCALAQVIRKAAAEGRIWEAWWDDYDENTESLAIPGFGRMGFETIWVDAWWFPQPWGANLGNWYPRPDAFGHGIRPLSDLAHEHGMDFLLWFIPQGVSAGTAWAKEHPHFIHGGGEGRGGLWKMGDPEARRWLTDWLCDRIKEWGIDIYREDGSDLPPEEGPEDRRGIAEMHHVEGMYTFYSELIRRNPGLRIDNCCGGGNRIDVETMKRCYFLHRSDLNDWPRWQNAAERPFMPTANQNLIGGLSLYVPIHAGPTWQMHPYAFRSNMTGGGAIAVDFEDENFPIETARRAIAELKELRPLFLGDIHPLITLTDSDENWYAYQLDRPDLGEGCAFFFRRPLSDYLSCRISLRNIDPDADYMISVTGETYEQGDWKKANGGELQALEIRIDEKPGSALVRYRKE